MSENKSQMEEIFEQAYQEGMTKDQFLVSLHNMISARLKDSFEKWHVPKITEWDDGKLGTLVGWLYDLRRNIPGQPYSEEEQKAMSRAIYERDLKVQMPDGKESVSLKQQGFTNFFHPHLNQSGENTGRFVINANMDPKMIEQLDKMCEKYNCYYKFPSEDNWHRRIDTVNLYFYENITEDIKQDVCQVMKPFVRSNGKNDLLDGTELVPGITYAVNETPAEFIAYMHQHFDVEKFPEVKKILSSSVDVSKNCEIKSMSLGQIENIKEFFHLYTQKVQDTWPESLPEQEKKPFGMTNVIHKDEKGNPIDWENITSTQMTHAWLANFKAGADVRGMLNEVYFKLYQHGNNKFFEDTSYPTKEGNFGRFERWLVSGQDIFNRDALIECLGTAKRSAFVEFQRINPKTEIREASSEQKENITNTPSQQNQEEKVPQDANPPVKPLKDRTKLNIKRIERRLSKSPKRDKETGILLYPYESESGNNELYKAVLPNKNVFYLRKKEGKFTFYNREGCLAEFEGKICHGLNSSETRYLMNMLHARDGLSVATQDAIYERIGKSLKDGVVHPKHGFCFLDGKNRAVLGEGATKKTITLMEDGRYQVTWKDFNVVERTDIFESSQALAKSIVRAKKIDVLREQRAKNAGRTFEEQLVEENKGELVFFGEKVNGWTKVSLFDDESVLIKDINGMNGANASFLAQSARLCRCAAAKGIEFAAKMVKTYLSLAKNIEKKENPQSSLISWVVQRTQQIALKGGL